MISALVAIGLASVIIRGQSIKSTRKKPLEGFPEELKHFLRELNWYI